MLNGQTRVQFAPFPKVQYKEDFLGRKIKKNRRVTIPHIIKKSHEVGIVENFARAAGIRKGDYIGLPNADEFLYKALEAASYELLYEYDAELDRKLNEIIAMIAAAQEPDGYLRTPHTIHWRHGGMPERAPRWTRLDRDLELYSLGHMYEAAVAHYRATGKTSFLDVARKSADLVDRLFGVGKHLRGVDMIPEIELALVKLYEATGERKYLELAHYFIEERGDAKGHKLQGEFALDHAKLIDQQEAVGHATFAAYLYSGAADLVYYGIDDGYVPAIQRLWNDSVFTKMSINGGFGALHENEGFSKGYDLPNLTAYNEICAAVGYSVCNLRMFRIDPHGKYFDVMERTIYNNLLSGVSMDGTEFFYVCPTESDGKYKFNLGWCPDDYDGPYKESLATRKEWIPCACCPPTLARFLPQIPSLAYAVLDDNLYVNLYLSTRAELEIGGQEVIVNQSTDYPWDESIRLSIESAEETEFTLRLRIPGWLGTVPIHGDLYRFVEDLTAEPIVWVNGEPAQVSQENGYTAITRAWRSGDEVELVLPMLIRRVISHPKVKQDIGKVAIQRGPVLYCAESYDNGGTALNISVPDSSRLSVEQAPELLGGLPVVTGEVMKREDSTGAHTLHKLVAIPYYAWSNRGENEMVVWFNRC